MTSLKDKLNQNHNATKWKYEDRLNLDVEKTDIIQEIDNEKETMKTRNENTHKMKMISNIEQSKNSNKCKTISEPMDASITKYSSLYQTINAVNTAPDITENITTYATYVYRSSTTLHVPSIRSIIQVLQYNIALTWILNGYNAYTYAYVTHTTLMNYEKVYSSGRH